MKKENQTLRTCAGLLAAVLTVTSLQLTAGLFPQTTYAAQTADDVGGYMDFVTEEIVSVQANGSAALRSIRSELAQYDWDCYSNDYYYTKLTAKEQLLYERLDAVCGRLLTAQADAESYTVKRDGATYERCGTETVSTLGLTKDQVRKVQTLFVYANPQYYFLNTILFTTTNDACALGIYESFAKGSARENATQEVAQKLEELIAQVPAGGTVYETDQKIHEVICDSMSYLKGDVLNDLTDPYYTQTMYGALTGGATVCAGYTKLYEALCNYFNIDCIAVTSATHAWNLVRYGEHWYIVDVTWNDTKDRTRFYHISEAKMTQTDQDNDHVPNALYASLLPVADASFSDELRTMYGAQQPLVNVTDTAAGLRITLESDGESYYTLDGTTPQEDDRYTQPIELSDSGTYVVTAVARQEGMLESPYEIFTVRVAGGSVKISSAANVSGKKIRVKYTSKKSYAGYEVSYASKKDFSNEKTARVRSKSVQIKGLKKGKTYYIRVRGYKTDAYGNYYYTAYSKAKKVTVKK